MIRKRASYPIEFKLKVVQEAKKIGDRKAGRFFDIPSACVQRWRANEQTLQKAYHDKQNLKPQFKIRKRTYDSE